MGTLDRLAEIDELTAIKSRRAFFEEIRRRLAERQTGVLLICDVDGFKDVNDAHGHPTGDLVLAQIARIISHHGLAGRLGWDEFALWVDDQQQAEAASASVIGEVGRAFASEIGPQAPSISIGAAAAPANGTDVTSLLQASDHALYEAKRRGGATLAHRPRRWGGHATRMRCPGRPPCQTGCAVAAATPQLGAGGRRGRHPRQAGRRYGDHRGARARASRHLVVPPRVDAVESLRQIVRLAVDVDVGLRPVLATGDGAENEEEVERALLVGDPLGGGYASYFNGGIAFHAYAHAPAPGFPRLRPAPVAEAPFAYAFMAVGTHVTVH